VTSTAAVLDPAVRRARLAVVTAFVMNGLGYGSFISRMPGVRADLGLSTAELGLLLLCLSIASIAALPAAGPIVTRLGPSRGVLAGSLSLAAGLAFLGLGLSTAQVVLAGIGLALCGAGSGVWDVSMNVEGADVERRLGRSLMPKLHAAFSIGMVGGAGLGAASASAGVPLAVQVLAVAVLVPPVMVLATRHFLGRAPVEGEEEQSSSFGFLDAWKEPRTIVLGLMVLGFAMTEGSANDWVAVALVDGYAATQAVGAVAFGCFTAAMTVGRFVGGSLLDRFGRIVVLRCSALLALAGLALVLFGGIAPLALLGAVFWGFGAALGFPVGMSAAADDPARAAARVSAVASIGYLAFLAGPPLIGPLAQHTGILHALLVVVGAITLALFTTGAARPQVQKGS
jgi:MFS family permease